MAIRHPRRATADACHALQERFPDRTATLTGSGTMALTLALLGGGTRAATRVALPAYACPDLGTAAVAAEASISLYDVDPETLGPDWDSLDRALIGATHVVGVHLLGRAIDIPELSRRAAQVGAVVIEDAAQSAGARLGGVRAGALADLSILSFGRGKGLNAGGGGALLSKGPWSSSTRLAEPHGELRHLVQAAASEWLSHPAAYWVPAAIPSLELGATVYHAPQPLTGMKAVAAAILPYALQSLEEDIAARRIHEAAYASALESARGLRQCRHVEGATSGALRFPILADASAMHGLARLGVARAYPRTLMAYPEIASRVVNPAVRLSGATELASRLHTLPTHARMRTHDRTRLIASLGGAVG